MRWGSLAAAVLESYDSGLPYEAAGSIVLRDYVQNPGYADPPDRTIYFFTKPASSRTDDVTRTDLALTVTVQLFRNVELFVRPDVLNLFNEKAVVAVDNAVLTALNASTLLQPFNPFTETPVRGVHYELPSSFGSPTGAADYQPPRTFRISTGVRF
jgi:hypothetical protein